MCELFSIISEELKSHLKVHAYGGEFRQGILHPTETFIVPIYSIELYKEITNWMQSFCVVGNKVYLDIGCFFGIYPVQISDATIGIPSSLSLSDSEIRAKAVFVAHYCDEDIENEFLLLRPHYKYNHIEHEFTDPFTNRKQLYLTPTMPHLMYSRKDAELI